MAEVEKDTTAADAKANAAVDATAAKDKLAAVGTTDTPEGPKVPEKYALTKPDGTLLSDKALERVSEIAKALKLTTDADAQSLLSLADEQAKEVIATYEAARKPDGAVHKALVQQYEAESLRHPHLGNGDPLALERKALNAGLVLNQFAPELAPILKASGLAGKAEVLLFLNRLHEAFSEKALATADGTPKPKPQEPLEKRMFAGLDTALAKVAS